MKKIFKEIIRYILYFVKKKKYKVKINESVAKMKFVKENNPKHYFFGYYDRSPERNGWVLFQEMSDDEKSVDVVVRNAASGTEIKIATVSSFNWQMGCRSLWIDDDTISFNDFDGLKYVCKWYSIGQKNVVKIFDKPLQDYSTQGKFFIGINYQRLRSYAKEYGYYCLPQMTDEEFSDYANDGLWKVEAETGKSELLISLAEILAFEPNTIRQGGKHFVNHVMMNPNGKSFIFIHRYYVDCVRYDRLMYYDFSKLKCLTAGRIQSHYCWIDSENVFGYGIVDDVLGFHTINVVTGEKKIHHELNRLHPRDGHPSCHGDFVVIDNYPDLARMQSLILYNLKSHEIVQVAEFFHSLKNKEFNRCDLHPRFANDGSDIYIDTIYSGLRHLCKISINWKRIN